MLAQAMSSTSPDGCEQNEQRGPDFADDDPLKWGDAGLPAGIFGGKLNAELGGDGIKIGLNLRERDFGLQPADDLEPMPSPARYPGTEQWIGGQRNPDLIGLGDLREAKGGRCDADDGERLLVEIDGGTDDFWIAAEGAAPEIFAEHDDGSGTGLAVFSVEDATHDGLHLKKWKELCGGDRSVDDERFAMAGQRQLMGLHGGEFDEDVALAAQIFEISVGPAGVGALLGLLEDVVELLGAGIRKRFEQRSVDDAEDGGVCADTERQSEHGDRGEAGILAQHAKGKAKILREGFDQR